MALGWRLAQGLGKGDPERGPGIRKSFGGLYWPFSYGACNMTGSPGFGDLESWGDLTEAQVLEIAVCTLKNMFIEGILRA